MDYSKLSDTEINQIVTAIEFDCEKWEFNEKSQCYFHCGIDGEGLFVQKVIDYCNNPSDAWPIILDNKISIFPTSLNECKWQAESALTGIAKDKNPLRAAMIVYLMMQDEKAGES